MFALHTLRTRADNELTEQHDWATLLGGRMNNDNDDFSSSGGKGSWWSRMSRSEQIVAAVVGAVIVGVFGVVTAFLSNSSHSSSTSTRSSSPAPVATPPTRSGTPSPGSVVEDPSPSASIASSSGQYLAYFTPVSNYGTFDTGSAAINGHNYLNSVILDMNFGSTSVAYNLERQWHSLKASVGLRDDSTQKDEYEFQVFADGRPIYSHIFVLGQSQRIRLNIVGVLRLELRATLVGAYYGEAYGVWGNADLTS